MCSRTTGGSGKTQSSDNMEYLRNILKQNAHMRGSNAQIGNSQQRARRKSQDGVLRPMEIVPPPVHTQQHATRPRHAQEAQKKEKLDKIQAPPTDAQKSNEETNKLWIHCNYCFEPYIKRRRPAYLLSCHHILCSTCVGEVGSHAAHGTSSGQACKCQMCEKEVRMIQIGNNMPNNLKALFHPKPWEADVSPQPIIEFQARHRAHLEAAVTPLRAKLQKTKEKTAESRQRYTDLLEQHRNLKIEMSRLAREVRQISLERQQEKAKLEQSASYVLDSTPNSSVQGSTTGNQRRHFAFFEPHNVQNRPGVLPFQTFAKHDFNL